MVIYRNSIIKKKCGDVDCDNFFDVAYRLRNKKKLCLDCGDLNARKRRCDKRNKLKLLNSELNNTKV